MQQPMLFQLAPDGQEEDKPRATVGAPSYRTARAADGTFTIFDVPIFASHVEERSDGREIVFSADWLKGALDTSLRRQAEGYLPPLHVRHHGDGVVEAAGKFRPTRIGKIMHDGEEVDALFADLVGVRPSIYERIRRGELSYRSVEILDVGKEEIDSLALLDDEVPFFRFPLLRVAEDPGTVAPGNARVTLAAACAAGPTRFYTVSGAGHGTAALFRFKEQPMTEPHTGAAEPVDATHKQGQAEQVLMQIFQLLQQVLGMPNGQPQAGPGPVEQPAMEQRAPLPIGSVMNRFSAEAEAETAEAETSSTSTLAVEGATDGLAARLAQLESKFTAMEQKARIESRAAELATRGFSADQLDKFRAVAREHGINGGLIYAQSLEDHGPSVPPSHWSGEIRGEAPDSPEVAAYASKGPELLAAARDFYRSWKTSGSNVPFSDYFESNHDADAFLGLGRK